jgi:hypothetical protein
MKKLFIGSFVGSVILFVWSFLAWAILPIHLHTINYTPVQDTVLKILADANMQTGAYAMPMADNRNAGAFDATYHEESEKLMKENQGKPMASVYYLKDGYQMNIPRGFLFDFLAVLAACIILVPAFTTMNTFFQRWWLTLVVGLLVNACGPLINYNWMGMPWNYTVDIVLDNFLNWGITGVWLAWYFGRAKS